MKNRYLFLMAVALPVILLDQATKLLIVHKLEYHESITVIGNFFDIIHARNPGAAFSFLSNSSFRLPFLITISLVASVAVIAIYRKLMPEQKLTALSLALILGGAVGNLIDRIRLGEVIDFLNVHWYQHYWPAFNVADSALCVGVGLLAVDMILEERRKKKRF
ncbi:signal peptidase II [bacterium]|nr:signal peptidase II [bacterium]